jgi:WD40 repeat protein
MKLLIKVFVFILILNLLFACDNRRLKTSRATCVSISSDGRYVLSVHAGHYLVLWDIKNKTKKIINQQANYYSAYFIKHSPYYLWQDKDDNKVYVQAVDGKIIKMYDLDFQVESHRMTDDLEHYVATDENWNVIQINQGKKILLKKGFHKHMKILSLSLNKNLLISAGDCGLKGEDLPVSAGLTAKAYYGWNRNYDYSLMPCITLYDLKQAKAIKKFYGHASKTVGALSPNGDFVISGDEATRVFLWDIQQEKKIHRLASIWRGIRVGVNQEKGGFIWDDTGLIKPPKDFQRCYGGTNSCSQHSRVNALKFITKDQYLRFTTGIHYAILYDLSDPMPKKYFPLHTDPETFVYSYLAEPTIDTAPEAGILVMSQTGNISPNYDKNVNYFGINVFKYDRQKQTLDLIWAPKGPPAHKEEKRVD